MIYANSHFTYLLNNSSCCFLTCALLIAQEKWLLADVQYTEQLCK